MQPTALRATATRCSGHFSTALPPCLRTSFESSLGRYVGFKPGFRLRLQGFRFGGVEVTGFARRRAAKGSCHSCSKALMLRVTKRSEGLGFRV